MRNWKASMAVSALLFVQLLSPAVGLETRAAAAADSTAAAHHWASSAMQKWQGRHIVSGNEHGDLMPNAAVTRAEYVTMLSRLFGYSDTVKAPFKDVPEQRWYAPSFNQAYAAGIVTGDRNGYVTPNAAMTRQEAAVLTARAFALAEGDASALTGFADAGKLPAWSVGSLSALVMHGYLNGKPGGVLDGTAVMTRSEAVTMLDRIIAEVYSKSGDYSQDVQGSALVRADQVRLTNMIVSGDLYIAQGVREGHIELDHLTVKGKSFIWGGGADSIVIRNSSLQGEVIVQKPKVKLEVNSPIAKLTVAANDVEVVVGQGGSIGTLVLNGSAKVTGQGSIDRVDVNAEGTEIGVKVKNLNVKDGTAPPKVMNPANPDVTPPVTNPTSPGTPGDSGSSAPQPLTIETKEVVPIESHDVLLNPGKGWVLYGSPDNQTEQTMAKATTGYMRFSWSQLEPEEGKYNWALIDNALSKWSAHGKMFAFGVMNANSSDLSNPYVTPKWVFDAGAKFTLNEVTDNISGQKSTQYVPKWDDPVFMTKLGHFLQALADKYDGDPHIAFIDIRSYGNWGEGHTGGLGSDVQQLDNEGVKAHIQLHLDAFKKTQLIQPYGLSTYADAYNWAVQRKNVGMRRDGILGAATDGGSDGSEVARTFGYSPTVYEFYAKYSWLADRGLWSADALRTALDNGKPSYIGMGQWDDDASALLNDEPDLIDELANKMGYHFIVKKAVVPVQAQSGVNIPLDITWHNKGVAPIYAASHTAVALLNSKNEVVARDFPRESLPYNWYPGEDVTEHLVVRYNNVPAGSYKLAIGLLDSTSADKPAIRLGIEGGTADNWYVLSDIRMTPATGRWPAIEPGPQATKRPVPPPVPKPVLHSEASYGTPVIDGEVDEAWAHSPIIYTNRWKGKEGVTGVGTSSVRLLWDEHNLYLLSQVEDPVLQALNSNPWEQDSVEYFIDENNDKSESYHDDDYNLRVNINNVLQTTNLGAAKLVTKVIKRSGAGYTVEVKIPFKTIEAKEGTVIGFDTQVNDDPGTGKRETTASWSDTKDLANRDTSVFGEIKLVQRSSYPSETPNPPKPAPGDTEPPAQITDIPSDQLALWLKSDQMAGADVDTDGTVKQWKDASHSGILAKQNAPSKRPVLVANALNGKPAVHFDGQDDFLNLGNPEALNIQDELTVIAVSRSGAAGDGTIYSKGEAVRLGQQKDRTSFSVRNVSDTVQTVQHNSSPAWNIVAGTYTAAGLKLYVGGGSPSVQEQSGSIRTQWDPQTLLGTAYSWHENNDYYYDRFFQGDLAELIIYRKGLSTSQLDTVLKYLNDKYNLGASQVNDNGNVQSTDPNVIVDTFDGGVSKAVYTSGNETLAYTNWKPEYFDDDAGRVQARAENAYLLYQTPQAVQSIEANYYQQDLPEYPPVQLKFEVSPDGVTFTDVTPAITVAEVPKAVLPPDGEASPWEYTNRKHYKYTLASVPAGSKYVKISFTHVVNNWNGDLTDVRITCGSEQESAQQ